MKNLLFLLFILVGNLGFAQSHKISEISGMYHIGSGAGLYITDNHTAYVVAMGTLLKGDVKIEENKVFIIFPEPEQSFSVFGRFRNEKEKGGFVMMFNFNEYAYINYKSNNEHFNSMDRVFNREANCWKYPYVFDEKEENPSKIYLALDDESKEVFEFDNQEKFNDFIVIHHKKPEIPYLFLQISKDKKSLKFMENGEFIHKRALNKEETDFITGIEKYFNATDISNEFHYVNPSYNDFLESSLDGRNGFDLKHYTKKQKGKEYYFLNGKDIKSTDYHDTNIIYEYKRLPVRKLENKTYHTTEKHLLYYSCEK